MLARKFLWLAFFFPGILAADDLRSLKPEIGPPVIQELMGGCCLRCAFPWTVEVSNAKGKKVADYATNDSSAETAWIDESPGGSIGTKLVFRFPQKLAAELRETPFYGIDFASGNLKSEELWKQYARIKRVRLFYNNQPLYDLIFKDTRRWQKFNFDDILIKPGDQMTLEILEVYPGSRDQHAAVTEIVLQGAH